MIDRQQAVAGSVPITVLLVLLGVLYFAAGTWGYGNDCDTYLMLRSGQNLLLNGNYQMSRPPGYFVPEVLIGAMSMLGGHLATNLLSALMAISTLFMFWRLLRGSFAATEAILLTALVGCNPVFFIAASSSMDYIYSLFFLMAGVTLCKSERPFPAGLLFALAVSSRLSNSLVIGVIYCYSGGKIWQKKDKVAAVRHLLAGVVAILAGLALYLPSFRASGNTLAFLSYVAGSWSFWGHLARFVYKNIYLTGLLPFLLLSGLFMLRFIRKGTRVLWSAELSAGLVILLVHELLFFKVPLETGYLLPLLFVIFPMAAVMLQLRPRVLIILLLLQLSHGFLVNLDILDRRYNATGQEAVGAETGLFIRPGAVINDLRQREASRDKYFKEYGIQRDQPDQASSFMSSIPRTLLERLNKENGF